MDARALWLACVAVLLGSSLGCYQCFISVLDSSRLCMGHILSGQQSHSGIPSHDNIDACFKKLDTIFNSNPAAIEAGRVGEGYDEKLKEILEAEILPIVHEFEGKVNDEAVYDARLQTAADNFIAAASKLPRVSECVPPCGFQVAGAVYNCVTCRYDSCEFPLDCPVKEMNATESSRSQMLCEVPFHLPDDILVIWRFAEELKTQKVDFFEEVTVGQDTLYSIPAVSLEHQGTYQCEIYSGQRSIVRLYYYLSVTPRAVAGYMELQELFELSLLPAGRLLPPSDAPHPLLLPSPLLLTACLTSVLLLLFLSLGALILSLMPQKRRKQGDGGEETSQHVEDPASVHRGRSLSGLLGIRRSTPGQAASSSQG